MSANSKYVLQASYLFCMSIHLFISVLQCSGVCSAGLWGCFLLQEKTSTWGQGSPSLGDLKQSHNIWVEGSASFGARAKEQEQLCFIPAIPQVSWLVCLQYNHSWEILCGPWCYSRLCELTDFTLLLYSQGIFVYQCPLGFVLVENLPGTQSWMSEERYKCCAAVQQAGVGCSPMGAGPILCGVRPAGKQEWEVYGERPYFHLQCSWVLEISERIMILISWKNYVASAISTWQECVHFCHCPPTSALPCPQIPMSQGWRWWLWSIKTVVPVRDDLCYQTPSRQNQGLLHHRGDIWRADHSLFDRCEGGMLQ